MKKRILSFILATLMIVSLLPVSAFAAEDTITVSTYNELTAALENANVKTVIVSNTISLVNGNELNGQGKTVTVLKPYLTAGGTVTYDYSDYCVFKVDSGAAVTISNMTIFGGGASYSKDSGSNEDIGGIYNNGTLTMENVNISRSYRGVLNDSSGKLIMKNTNVVNNAAKFGGGIVNNGTLVMDGCSLSANRSLMSGNGGGAAENRGTMYINNTVIANNCSTEMGGAINNLGNGIYVMNSTFTGNVTTAQSDMGGAIGNHSNPFYAVNSIFVDNYSIQGSNVTRSDIGSYYFSDSYVKLYYCLYKNVSSGASKVGCKSVSNDTGVFAAYETTGINSGISGKTAAFTHSVTTAKDPGGYALNTPVKADGAAAAGGVYATYFDYSDLSSVKMSYKASEGSSMTSLGGLTVAGDEKKVTRFYGSADRLAGYFGASAVGDKVYTIGGSVTAASLIDSQPTEVPDAEVLIYDNNNALVDSTVTDSNGNYLSHGLANGTYTVKCTLDSRTASENVTISNENVTDADILFVATGLYLTDVDSNISDFSVDGLETEAERLYNTYTGDPVALLLTLHADRQSYDERDTEHAALKTAAGDKRVELLSVDLEKDEFFASAPHVNAKNQSSVTLLTLTFPVHAKGVDPDTFAVYAYNDGEIKTFTKWDGSGAPADGTFKLVNGYISIYTTKSDTYCIAYQTGKLDISALAVNYSGLPVFSVGTWIDYYSHDLASSAISNAPTCDYAYAYIGHFDNGEFHSDSTLREDTVYYLQLNLVWDKYTTDPFSSVTYPAAAYQCEQFEESDCHGVVLYFRLGTPQEVNEAMGIPQIDGLPDAYYGQTAGDYITAVKTASMTTKRCAINKNSINVVEVNPDTDATTVLDPAAKLSSEKLYVLSLDFTEAVSASAILVNGSGVSRTPGTHLDLPFSVLGLYVNGQPIEPNTPHSGSESGTLTFDAQNHSLTLDGFKDTATVEDWPHIWYGSTYGYMAYNCFHASYAFDIGWIGDCATGAIGSEYGLNLKGGSGTLTVTADSYYEGLSSYCGDINIENGSNITITSEYTGIWSDGDINIESGADITITSDYDDGIYTDVGDINIADGTNVTIDANDDGLYAYYGSINISGGTITIRCDDDAVNSEVGITISGGTINIDAGYWGLEADKICITGGVTDITSYYESMDADDGVYISGGKTSVKSLDEYAIDTYDFQMTGGELDVQSQTDDGINISEGDCRISGGELTVNAAEDGIYADNLYVTGGYVSVIGGDCTLNIDELYENSESVDDWYNWYYRGGVYYAYNGTTPIVSVDGQNFTSFMAAADYAFDNDEDTLTVLRNVPFAGSILTDGTKTLTIDAKGYMVGTLNIFCTASAQAPLTEFKNAANLKGSLSFENGALLNYYYNDGADEPIAVTGVSASQFGIFASGYTMYQAVGAEKNLTVIRTDEARFAVAEALNGEIVSSFRFYKTFAEAKEASAAAAVPNTVYVLNYVNLSDPSGMNFSQTDITQATPIDLSGLTLATVSRVTDGTYSTFYDYDTENQRPDPQYNNGSEIKPEVDTNMKATLIGNFTGNHTERNIIVANANDLTTLTLRDESTDTNTLLYMTVGEAAPTFSLHSRVGYTLTGYFTKPTGGDKIIDANGSLVANTIASDATAKWKYGKDLTLYAQWEITKYTVTFNANGHGTAPQALTNVVHGSKITAPTAPTAEGYTFDGWYTDKNFTNAWNFAVDTVTDNITLYAKWTVKEQPSPSGSFSSTSTTVPANGNGSSIRVSATVSGSTATVTIKDDELAKLVGGENVEIDLTGLGKTINTVKISTVAVGKIGAQSGMSIKLSTASIAFDKAATQEIAEQAGGSTIELKANIISASLLNAKQKSAIQGIDNALVLDISVLSGGKKLCTADLKGFGDGKATVSVPFTVPAGKNVKNYSVYYVAEDGTLQKLNAAYDAVNKAFVFDITHFSVYVIGYDENAGGYASCPQDATCPISKFTDTEAKAWYHDGIHFCLENGLMNGVGNDMFAPHATLTRGMVVTMLARMSGVDMSTDGAWYVPGMNWAVKNGISDGTNMTGAITREQLAAMLYRYAVLEGISTDKFTENTNTLSYDDVFTVSDWATSGMHFCIAAGVIQGSNGKLRPADTATRAEAATMFQRFCETVLAK